MFFLRARISHQVYRIRSDTPWSPALERLLDKEEQLPHRTTCSASRRAAMKKNTHSHHRSKPPGGVVSRKSPNLAQSAADCKF